MYHQSSAICTHPHLWLSSRRLRSIVILIVSCAVIAAAVATSLWPAPVEGADLFQDTFAPYNEQELKVYLAKRALNNNQYSLPLLLEQTAAGDGSSSEDPDAQQRDDSQEDAESEWSGEPEVYLLEDKDYPTSVFENYAGVGQVSGLAALPSGDLALFHRSDREWTDKTFNDANDSVAEPVSKAQDNLIKNDTIMVIDGETGNSKLSFGANLFYMPHGIASDSKGNLWVTDVGRHQVMRLPTSQIHLTSSSAAANNTLARKRCFLPSHMSRLWPDIILGEAFVPGGDENHFCKPSEVAVSSDDRLVYVADGYCNKRIMVFTGEGKFLVSFGEEQDMSVVHSLALIEERNLICAADRENGRILCFKAGLDGDLASIGELALKLHYPIGRVYALAQIDANHLLVSGQQIGTRKFDLAALNPFLSTIKQVWTSSDLLSPHSLARTKDGRYIYAADLSREAYKKVFKFYVIQDRA